MTAELWFTVTLIGAATVAARLLPLLWRQQSQKEANAPPWLNALGPCLLTAMGVAVVLPEGVDAVEAGRPLLFTGGAAAAAIAMLVRRDPGLAAIAGVAGWWLMSALQEESLSRRGLSPIGGRLLSRACTRSPRWHCRTGSRGGAGSGRRCKVGLRPEKGFSVKYGFRPSWRMKECPRRNTSRKRSWRSSAGPRAGIAGPGGGRGGPVDRVTQFTYHKWRKGFGGLKIDQFKRLKENERLRKAASDLTLEKLILREAASGNF